MQDWGILLDQGIEVLNLALTSGLHGHDLSADKLGRLEAIRDEVVRVRAAYLAGYFPIEVAPAESSTFNELWEAFSSYKMRLPAELPGVFSQLTDIIPMLLSAGPHGAARAPEPPSAPFEALHGAGQGRPEFREDFYEAGPRGPGTGRPGDDDDDPENSNLS